jgi:hypothetical protein
MNQSEVFVFDSIHISKAGKLISLLLLFSEFRTRLLGQA